MRDYFERITDDLDFFRIVMVLWSLPVFAIVVFSFRDPSQFFENNWLLLIPSIALLLGGWLIYSATCTDDKTFEKRIDCLADGGDWGGLVFVFVVVVLAVPIYELRKLIRSNRNES